MDAKLEKIIFERLRKSVYSDKKPVYVNEIVDEYQVKSAVVNGILEKFVNIEKARKAPISVSYVLSGTKNDDGDDVKLMRFVIVDEDEFEERKKFFTELIGTQIRSISPKNDDVESSDPVFRKASLPHDLASLEREQKLGGITNKLIKLRLNRLNKLKENGWTPEENISTSKQSECNSNKDGDFTKLSNSIKKAKVELKSEEDDCDKAYSSDLNKKAAIRGEQKVKGENDCKKENAKDKIVKNKDVNDMGNEKKKIKLESNLKEEVKTDGKAKNFINAKSESKSKAQNNNRGKKPLNPNQKVRLITDMFVRKEKPTVN